jgi:diaminohydroxyphosphoribosylaminopyrimidine deaminase/5-amino-6-(5-phosphoribosylamino)uracil reductase
LSKRDEVDRLHMARAVELARQGEGLTRPNPPVGAVCVSRGEVVGEGFHRRAGGPHAEIGALRAAGSRARGATLYVTLEPCSTQGRTPACTEAVLAAGIRRVVAGSVDPNPAHAGRGFRVLKRRGVEVEHGVCRSETDALIAPYAKWMVHGRPYLTLKLGLSLDGRIADGAGQSRWITGAASRRAVQALRRRADAVMVGRGTLVEDDPSLCPRPARGRKPYRVIVSASGRVSATAKVFTDKKAGTTVLATTRRCPQSVLNRAGQRASVWVLPERGGGVSLDGLLRRMGEEGFLHVLCEGGGRLAEALVRGGYVDEYRFFYAPCLLGGGGVGALSGKGWPLEVRPELEICEVERYGRDLCVVARPER